MMRLEWDDQVVVGHLQRVYHIDRGFLEIYDNMYQVGSYIHTLSTTKAIQRIMPAALETPRMAVRIPSLTSAEGAEHKGYCVVCMFDPVWWPALDLLCVDLEVHRSFKRVDL